MKNYFDNPSYDAALELCINLMTDMMVKYGPKVLQAHRQQLIDALRYPEWSKMQDQDLRFRRMKCYQTRFERLKIAV